MTRSGIRRILFASDFSKASGKAFATAVTMAKNSRATLTVLHVIAPLVPVSSDQYSGADTWRQLEEAARRWTQQKLTALTSTARKKGVQAASSQPPSRILLVSTTSVLCSARRLWSARMNLR
jgi:nucleotide-binding universal stress UspA family protein